MHRRPISVAGQRKNEDLRQKIGGPATERSGTCDIERRWGEEPYISHLDMSLPASWPLRISVEEMVTSGAFKSQIL